ncbi:diaminopimelate decarboxylase [Lachnospiraceae bacterium NE2001]|nr:diaminopimelate decarboxylase [Lachnospiraceae bacterium NE2001]
MKTPFVTKEQVEEIVKTYPTPFHIYDEKGIRENARAMNDAFSWNKGFKEYFAVKATPNPTILKILHEEGCGTDCSSLAELILSERAGITGYDVMFSSNETPAEEFVKCAEIGGIINLDDITHIDFVLDALDGKLTGDEAGRRLPKRMSCRYNPGGIFKLGESGEAVQVMDNPGDAKYGMTKDQIIEAYKRLSDLGVEELGIHSFLASNTLSNEYYPALAKILFELAVEIKEKTGVSLSFVNLSGGVGISYTPDKPGNDIAAIGEGVHKVFDEVLVPAGMGDVAIFTELGRFMLAPYGHLVTKAIHEKHTYKEYIGVDACAANLMRPAMYGSYHHVTVLGKEEAPLTETYDVVGSLCENNDKFAIDRKLPKIDIGDYLCIHDTGAHGFSMGYNYNGRLWSSELLLREDNSVVCIRRAETLDDYFATLDNYWDIEL